jgi:pimeloyl-ACP methyl ester carboxylesterase
MSSERQVRVGGLDVEYRVGGGGPALVYLHGGLADTDWHPALELWGQRYTVYQPLHPGFGGSTGGERMESIEDLVFHYLDWIEAVGLAGKPLTLVGNSFGGWIAAELAVRYPQLVERLCLIAAAGLWIDETPPAELFGNDPPRLAEILFANLDHPLAAMMRAVSDVSQLPEDVILRQFRAMEALARVAWNPYFHDPKLEGRLGRVRARTTVVWGQEDRFFPLEYGQRYAERIAGAELVVVPKAGHLVILERPEAVAQAL